MKKTLHQDMTETAQEIFLRDGLSGIVKGGPEAIAKDIIPSAIAAYTELTKQHGKEKYPFAEFCNDISSAVTGALIKGVMLRNEG